MNRDWSFLRLLEPLMADHTMHLTAGIPALLSGVVGQLRADDPGARWSFRPLADRHGPNLGLWLYSTPSALARADGTLRAEADLRGWELLADRYAPPTAKYQSDELVARAEALAEVSSDLALTLAGNGTLAAYSEITMAVLHLTYVVELVDEGKRPAFLFQCWEHWSRELTPAQRLELARRPAGLADEELRSAADARLLESETEGWRRYLGEIRQITAGLPPYLLFDHAHLTHRRLGISPRTEALAAQIVRNGVVSGFAPAAQLQPA